MKSAWRVAIDRTLPPKFSRATKPKCEGCQECMTRTVNKLWVPSATQTQLLRMLQVNMHGVGFRVNCV